MSKEMMTAEDAVLRSRSESIELLCGACDEVIAAATSIKVLAKQDTSEAISANIHGFANAAAAVVLLAGAYGVCCKVSPPRSLRRTRRERGDG